MDWLIQESPSFKVSSDEDVNVESLVVCCVLAAVLFALASNRQPQTSGGPINRNRTDRNDNEGNDILQHTSDIYSAAVKLFQEPSTTGSLMAFLYFSSFFFFIVFPKVFRGVSLLPDEVCVMWGKSVFSLDGLKRTAYHFLYLSNRSIFYWLVSCPAAAYLLSAILEPVLGPLRLIFTAAGCLLFTSYGTAAFAFFSSPNLGPLSNLLIPTADNCIFGSDGLLIALAVVGFIVNPPILCTGTSSSRSGTHTAEGRWLASFIGYFVFCFQLNSLAASTVIFATLSGICISFLLLKNDNTLETMIYPLFWHRCWLTFWVLAALSLPCSIMELPSSQEVMTFGIHLCQLNTQAWKALLGFEGYNYGIMQSPSIWGIVNRSLFPFPRLILRSVVWWLPCCLFTRGRGVTQLLAVLGFGVFFFTMASEWWHYPNWSVIPLMYGLIGLFRAQ